METKPVFEKILAPIDGSVPSLVAQELTAFIAKQLEAKVTVMHVVTHEFMYPQMQKFFPGEHEHLPMGPAWPAAGVQRHVPEPATTAAAKKETSEMTNWFHQKGEKILEDAVALFNEERVPVKPKLMQHSDPAETILKEAQQKKYDLIVVADSEDEETPHLGSVAKKVLHASRTPVLIARKKRQISRILVPVDGSKDAEKALKHAALLAKKTDAAVTLLYVQEPSLLQLRPETSREVGNRILAAAAKQVEGLRADQKLEAGDPAKTIIQTAEKGNYDLIVLGGKGFSALARALGSVTDHVAHYATVSTLITK